MTVSTQTKGRLDYLDAARALALLLGIVFHASLSFLPMFIGWAVMDISTSNVVSIFVLISHSFRMELFFLIAGFFSHMAIQKNGLHAFLATRGIRIVIPFIIGWFLLRPMLVSGWVIGAESMRGEADVSDGLIQGIMSLKDLPNGLFVGTHLWFLYYLIIITAIILILRSLISISPSVKHKVTALINKVIAWICYSPIALCIVVVPIAVSLWFMSHWGMDTPDKSLIPNFPVLFIYLGFFSLGWLINKQEGLMEVYAKLTWPKIVLCFVAVVLTVMLSSFQGQTGHPQHELLHVCFTLTYALTMWLLTSLFIGLCCRVFREVRGFMRYLASASYWLYLIHLPVVIWLQIAFSEIELHWFLKLISICTLTIAFSLVLYELFVRSTIIGTVLNGRKKLHMLAKKPSVTS
ncbi:acyltransferase family protein [Thalassotalea sediminis]|uniref:acyltransferase family protein n=1 Tax=Thalassotalea sediminis TaxID=1759089 RepID=UPI00257443D2|nr:acyltransferase family protein [Thalassotalea sediminis]